MIEGDSRKMETIRRDLPALIWLYFTSLGALVLVAAWFMDWPDVCEIMLRRDVDGAGVLEWATPVVLLPGIWAGAAVSVRLRGDAHASLLRTWVIVWTLACVYFAGEEISWGQWIFDWDTPEAIRSINIHGETNLHNMTNLLDNIPRFLVELLIVVGGLILPLWRKVRAQVLDENGIWYWILPTYVGTVAAGIWCLSQAIDWIAHGMTSSCNGTEMREFYIAVFLSLYLFSIWCRGKKRGT